MKKALFVLASVVVASVAQARPSTYQMTCEQAQDLVQTHGKIVMNHGYHDRAGHLYKMFYANSMSCRLEGRYDAERAIVRTTDVEKCWIGYHCVYSSRD